MQLTKIESSAHRESSDPLDIGVIVRSIRTLRLWTFVRLRGSRENWTLAFLVRLTRYEFWEPADEYRVRSLFVVVVFLRVPLVLFQNIVAICVARKLGGVDVRTISQTRSDETLGVDILNVWWLFFVDFLNKKGVIRDDVVERGCLQEEELFVDYLEISLLIFFPLDFPPTQYCQARVGPLSRSKHHQSRAL